MPNLVNKKSDFLSKVVEYAGKAEAIVREIAELSSYYTDNGFNAGGANVIADADCIGTNSHLTAALVQAAMAAIVNVNLNAAQKTTMRQVSVSPVP